MWSTRASGLVLSNLYAGYKARFYAVCKAWLPSHLHLISTNLHGWCNFPRSSDNRCNLFHPTGNATYHLDIPNEVRASKIRCAKYGWLLLSEQADHGGFQLTCLQSSNQTKDQPSFLWLLGTNVIHCSSSFIQLFSARIWFLLWIRSCWSL